MAALPPRRNSTPTKYNKQHLSPLQTLLQMGFSQLRVEKALAATGLLDVQLASDWLFAHVNDPTLDISCSREYVLYLCPAGALHEQIQSFWEESFHKYGWNAAHGLVPHITLCPFFKCSDGNCELLVSTLKDVCQNYVDSGKFPNRINLEKYVSPNYMGLFLNEVQAEIFRAFSCQFMARLNSVVSLSTEFSKKELHLTLAYSFPPAHYSVLESLSSSVNPDAPVKWEIRLYSRDVRVMMNEVHKVMYSHVPRESDELELLIGDFVYISSEAMATSIDGWVEGTSWLTGCTGYLPSNYIERTAESDSWTLLRTIAVVDPTPISDASECALLPRRPRISLSLLNLLESSEGSRRSTEIYSDISSQDKFLVKVPIVDVTQSVTNVPDEIDDLYAKIKEKPKMAEPLYHFPIEGSRRLIVARHGERVDFTFGDWLRLSYDETGSYKRWDQNMPVSLPKRAGEPHSYYLDSPLTNIGLMQAKLIGDGFVQSNTIVHHVFCSPSYRCVQTCTNILKGLGIADRLSINVEPGLFEWLAWYSTEFPLWMSHDEFLEAGFNINKTYEPIIKTEDLKSNQESCEQFYDRSAFVTQELLARTQREGGTVLLVAHAASVDTSTRHLVGGAQRSANTMTMLIRKIPYCSVSCAVEDGNGSWSLREPPSVPITHSSNIRYDWKTLLHS